MCIVLNRKPHSAWRNILAFSLHSISSKCTLSIVIFGDLCGNRRHTKYIIHLIEIWISLINYTDALVCWILRIVWCWPFTGSKARWAVTCPATTDSVNIFFFEKPFGHLMACQNMSPNITEKFTLWNFESKNDVEEFWLHSRIRVCRCL